jgi:hypothetical protein
MMALFSAARSKSVSFIGAEFPIAGRELIAQRMARENFLWGAPRIHGELLMLGFSVSQATCHATAFRKQDGLDNLGGLFCAIKPWRPASIPRSSRGNTRTCVVSPIGQSSWDRRLRRLLR